MASQKRGGGLAISFAAFRLDEESKQVLVGGARSGDSITRAFGSVVFAEGRFDAMNRIGARAARDGWCGVREFLHQLVDVLQLCEGPPSPVVTLPGRARRQPDGEGFGEVFVRVALCVPVGKVYDITPTSRIGSVVVGVGLG